VAVMATVAKGYDLDYAWRAVGETYRGAGYYLAAAEAGEPPGSWWGSGAERLGFTEGQQVEREPYNQLFGERKGPGWAEARTITGRPSCGSWRSGRPGSRRCIST
jgi:TrwC relaxase